MITLILFSLLGGLIYRYRGSDYNFRPVGQIMFSWPYLAVSGVIGFVCAFLATCTGHGNWQDLGTWVKPSKDERTEFVIKPLKKYLSPYWYDALGLGYSGMLVTLMPGLILGNPFIALSGLLKAPAYMISWKVAKGTWLGEFLTGAFLWGSLALICLLSYN